MRKRKIDRERDRERQRQTETETERGAERIPPLVPVPISHAYW